MDIQDAAMQPKDWAPYKRRTAFTRFELASLLQRLDPKRLLDRAWSEFHEHEQKCEPDRRLIWKPEEFAALIDARSGLLGEDVSSTYESLKKAFGGHIAVSITFKQSRIFASDFGIEWPVELIGAEQTIPCKPVQRSAAQDVAILDAICQHGYNPKKLPKDPNGRPGIRSLVKSAMLGKLGQGLFTEESFNKAWKRLLKNGDIFRV